MRIVQSICSTIATAILAFDLVLVIGAQNAPVFAGGETDPFCTVYNPPLCGSGDCRNASEDCEKDPNMPAGPCDCF